MANYINLANKEVENKNYDDAIKYLELAIKNNEYEACSNLAMFYITGLNVEEAKKAITDKLEKEGVARRVNNLLKRVGIEEGVLFTGGVSNNIGMRVALERVMGVKIQTAKLNPVFAGALGAALHAQQYFGKRQKAKESGRRERELSLKAFEDAVRNRKEEYTAKTSGKKTTLDATPKAMYFKTLDAFFEFYKTIPFKKGDNILIKASHGMHFDKILAFFKENAIL